jgi:hypothetical protein
MTRLMVIAIALLACAACVTVASFGAEHLGPWLQAHIMTARWFVPACNVFLFGGLGIAGLRHKKKAVEDDQRLTPLVRRDPTIGLRQL